jgi:hypothetical protein
MNYNFEKESLWQTFTSKKEFLIGKSWIRKNHTLFSKGFGPNIMEAVGR